MAISLQKFREIVFQLLYSRDFEEPPPGIVSLLMRTHTVPKKTVRLAQEKVDEIWRLLEELDQKIVQVAHDYELERIPQIEKAILRLGIYELFHSDLPPKVAISEALRLTRKFASSEGVGFVNALLDALYKEKEHATQMVTQSSS